VAAAAAAALAVDTRQKYALIGGYQIELTTHTTTQLLAIGVSLLLLGVVGYSIAPWLAVGLLHATYFFMLHRASRSNIQLATSKWPFLFSSAFL
jgi:fatty acid desaturase